MFFMYIAFLVFTLDVADLNPVLDNFYPAYFVWYYSMQIPEQNFIRPRLLQIDSRAELRLTRGFRGCRQAVPVPQISRRSFAATPFRVHRSPVI